MSRVRTSMKVPTRIETSCPSQCATDDLKVCGVAGCDRPAVWWTMWFDTEGVLGMCAECFRQWNLYVDVWTDDPSIVPLWKVHES